uniref:urease accessory protein UreF n=1 Tax=uncultured Rhizobium sp. TaxID=155567 RepID=UPI0026036253|nr:urease accessory UreF family protein [uncultured Rhizobium sp.]
MAEQSLSDASPRRGLLRLLAWLSPAFPVGGFAYSGGLESAIVDGHIANRDDLSRWLRLLLADGGLRNDAILLVEGHRHSADEAALCAVLSLASALAGSAERHAEIVRQGEAFVTAARAWPHPVLETLTGSAIYSVAVGAVAAAHGVSVGDAIAAFLQAQVSQLISVAIRLSVIGQTQGVALIAEIEADILGSIDAIERMGGDDLGSASIIAETLSMRHETQYSRLFQS